MSNTIGNTKDFDSSRKEALQGLLTSLGHGTDNPSSNAKLSAEQRQRLSEKIDEILGDDADHGRIQWNQASQSLNEDGLPIIDISEPVNEDSKLSILPLFVSEQDLIPLSLLPPDEKERRRRERDHILDLLEEEERLQQLQEERDAEEGRKEAIRKRKESAKAELEQLKAARELQKKMGMALIQHANETGEKRQDEVARSNPRATPPVAKKCVSFADMPAVEADERDQQTSVRQPDWGDVTTGRLRAQTRIPSSAEAQKYPMKTHVVERCSSTSPFHDNSDSDDESPSAEHFSRHAEPDSPDEDRSSLSNEGPSDDEPLDEGFDYDTAKHHREIALEYHKRRHVIGVETMKAMAEHASDEDAQYETSDEQLLLSRFRADRMVAAYDKSHGPISTSTEPTVIPASRRKSLRNSVKLGKMENNHLVGGGSGESGTEDETVREVIQMLRNGSIQNVGPVFKPSSMSTVAPCSNSDTMASLTVGTSTIAHGVRPSRFKLAREGERTDRVISKENNRRDDVPAQKTISSVVERFP